MSEYTEKFFISQPVASAVITYKSLDGNMRTVQGYTSDGETLKWSACFPLPAIGSRVYVTMNGIGWSVVKGYWSAAGWLGVMTLPENPPAYLRKQQREMNRTGMYCGKPAPGWMLAGIGCETGAEINLRKPVRKLIANE